MLLEMMKMPGIMEDEDIVGWLCAAASANGWDNRSFMSAFFPENVVWRRDSFTVMTGYRHVFRKYGALGFPEPQDMLMKHTSVPVSGLFTPAFYTGMLADLVLNGSDTLPFEQVRRHRPFVYCPLCAKEDMEKQGRAAVHIPHQVQGVTACYKHGVLLSEEAGAAPEAADGKKVRTARMVQALYRARAVGSLEDLTAVLRERISERGLDIPPGSGRFPVDVHAMEAAADLFTDDELLRAYEKDNGWILQAADIVRKDAPGAKYFSNRFPFISYTCGKCGAEVTQYAVTALTGGMCPVCAGRTQWQAKTSKRARHCMDPEFRIVRFHDKKTADIRHVPCGRVIEGRRISYIFRTEKMDCPFCKKDSREAHLGEKRKMNCGIMATVTAISSYANVTLRFEDGSERTGVQYRNFLLGNIVPEGFYRDSHIGETKMMDCGLEAEITRYESQFDMDVRFSDGSERKNVTYASFRTGKLQPEGFRMRKAAEEVIRKWRMMNCGIRARIIERRSSLDCDVEFEDGSVRRGVRQDHFLKGELSPEDFYLPRIGEERVMRNGLRAKIIAVRSSRDIDVRLENGEVRTGIQYTAFRDGYVKSETLEQQRKDSHIGEVYRQNCGLDAKIISYTNAHSCTVRFSNGEVREGVIYRKLKGGNVLPPSLQNVDRVGEKHMQDCGQEAEITADRGATDMDVRFPDGKTREHVTYYDITKGRVKPVKRGEKFRMEHLGEERVMKCGLKARIIAIRSAKDIDVQFETGEIREHIVYANFKAGGVSPVKRAW